MRVAARTAVGVFVVDVELDELVDVDADMGEPTRPHVDLPRVVAAAATGSTIVAVVDRRPPLAVSHDAGRTWRESGGGLPAGVAVAIDEDNPDRVVFAARNRLYVSEDGARFWRSLTPELPAIEAVAFVAEMA
jgi:hypothetical protein